MKILRKYGLILSALVLALSMFLTGCGETPAEESRTPQTNEETPDGSNGAEGGPTWTPSDGEEDPEEESLTESNSQRDEDEDVPTDGSGTEGSVADGNGTEGNGTEDTSPEPEPLAGSISFSTLTVDGSLVRGSFPNSRTLFSFQNEIRVMGDASYTVARDALGTQVVQTKRVSLSEGDNVLYVLEYLGGTLVNTYTVTLRRAPMYSVTFDTDGGTAVQPQRIEEGALATAPTTERVGYTFLGWDHDLTCPVTEDLTVKALWEAQRFTVTFDPKGGSAQDPMEVTFGEAYTLPTPTLDGYTFLYWYDDTVQYPQSGAWQTAKSVTLAAKWEKTSYPITYVLDGGTHENRERYTTEDAFSLTDAQRTGYDFIGWTCEGVTVPTKNLSVTVGTTGPLTFTAHWQAQRFTVTFDPRGGSVQDPMEVTFGEAYTLPTPTLDGYTFLYWYDDTAQYPQTLTWQVADDVHLTAKWQINTYTVSVIKSHTGAGEVSGGGSYTYGADVTLSATTNMGYDFLGWFAGSECLATGAVYTYTLGASSDTVEARWKIWEELSDFDFVSAPLTCTVTGVKDKTKTSYVIPSYATAIGDGAFADCTALENVRIPAAIKTVGVGAFEGCYALESVVFVANSRLVSIEANALKDCRSLSRIVIPAWIESIGENAFNGCGALSEVYYCGETVKEWNLIDVGVGNASLKDATRCYYRRLQPSGQGNYWHYSGGFPKAWGETVNGNSPWTPWY
ncbi:MAG: hypothetical protein E7643_09285 [Ruminococcaceae bacterium]|nr:hypothetical protein [Oscillospiraceae bacterium]